MTTSGPGAAVKQRRGRPDSKNDREERTMTSSEALEARMNDVRTAHREMTKQADILAVGVQQARLYGASWSDIGKALGVTRQAARQRWGRDELTSAPLLKDRCRIDYTRTKGRRWVAACTTHDERSNALGSKDAANAWAQEHERSKS